MVKHTQSVPHFGKMTLRPFAFNNGQHQQGYWYKINNADNI